eukprot:GHVT01044001.1.p2 GENE.GHVT01044001.1~~GHVT01044001.1.p2  ORF type:complete len:115 (+),score=6.79 GHVT01044001.1:3191-3535(+)
MWNWAVRRMWSPDHGAVAPLRGRQNRSFALQSGRRPRRQASSLQNKLYNSATLSAILLKEYLVLGLSLYAPLQPHKVGEASQDEKPSEGVWGLFGRMPTTEAILFFQTFASQNL